MSDAAREIGELLTEQPLGDEYPPGSVGAMFPEAAAVVERLVEERISLEVSLGKALEQRDQARRWAVALEAENAALLDGITNTIAGHMHGAPCRGGDACRCWQSDLRTLLAPVGDAL